MKSDIDFEIESYHWLLGFRGQQYMSDLEHVISLKGPQAAAEESLASDMTTELQECIKAAINYISHAASPPAELARKRGLLAPRWIC